MYIGAYNAEPKYSPSIVIIALHQLNILKLKLVVPNKTGFV
jgi:hypothetical protein